MKDDSISFWLSDGVVWIKPTGEACHLNSPKVKEFAREMVRRGTYDCVVDLKECTAMDEMFIGALAGIALRLYELKKGRVRLIGASADLEKQIRSYGLDSLFDM